MKQEEMEFLEAKVINDLKARHNSGDIRASSLLLEHVRWVKAELHEHEIRMIRDKEMRRKTELDFFR